MTAPLAPAWAASAETDADMVIYSREVDGVQLVQLGDLIVDDATGQAVLVLEEPHVWVPQPPADVPLTVDQVRALYAALGAVLSELGRLP